MDHFSLSSYLFRSFLQDAGLLVLLLVFATLQGLFLWVRLPRSSSARKIALRHVVLLFGLTLAVGFVCAAGVPRRFAALLVAWGEDQREQQDQKEDGPCRTPALVTVVLGGGLETSRLPSLETLLRLERAVEYLRGVDPDLAQTTAGRVILSGGGTVPTWGVAESSVMETWFSKLGGPGLVGEVLVEPRSRTTFENAQETWAMLAERPPAQDSVILSPGGHQGARSTRSITLVTSAEHLLRATLTFEKQGFEVCPLPAPPREYRSRSLFSFRSAAHFAAVLHEYLGLVGYWATGRI